MIREKQDKNNSYDRIISIYLLLCILGLIISIPIFNSMISKHDLQISNNMCGLIAEKMNSSITYITEAVSGRAEIISSYEIDDWNEMYSSLEANLKAEGYSSIGLVDINGKLYGKDNEEFEFQKWGLIQRARKSDKEFFSSPYRQAASGKMVFTIFAPIYQNGLRAGELFMTYNLEEIQNMANSEILYDNMQIYLMNPYSNNYICCFGEDSAHIGSWNNSRLLYDQIKTINGKSYSEWENQMREGKDGEVVFFEMDNIVYTQVFVNIDAMDDWSVVVRIPKDVLSHNVRIFNMALIAIIVVLILSLLILFILSNRNQKAEREKLEYLSSHDSLTKLINRRAFEDIYKSIMLDKSAINGKGALIFFDIDYFKQINDGFGHDMGDRAICEFAAAAREIFGNKGIVSRLGGDEFVILVKQLESRKKLEHMLKDLRKRMKALDFLVDSEGKIFKIHFSAGIVEVCDFEENLDSIEKKADKALYQVKRNGRDGFEWYN